MACPIWNTLLQSVHILFFMWLLFPNSLQLPLSLCFFDMVYRSVVIESQANSQIQKLDEEQIKKASISEKLFIHSVIPKKSPVPLSLAKLT